WRSQQPGLVTFLKLCWNFWTVLGYVAARRRAKAGVVILDQGLLQGIWSTEWSGSRPCPLPDWWEILEDVGLDDFHFVLCDVPEAVAQQRIAERDDSRARISAAEEENWERAGIVLSKIAAFFFDKKRHPCTRVNNTEGFEIDVGALVSSCMKRGPKL